MLPFYSCVSVVCIHKDSLFIFVKEGYYTVATNKTRSQESYLVLAYHLPFMQLLSRALWSSSSTKASWLGDGQQMQFTMHCMTSLLDRLTKKITSSLAT